MKKYILAFTFILAVMWIGGCSWENHRNEEEDLQRLVRLQVYSADDNTLINTVEEKELLIRFNKWTGSDFSYSEEAQERLKQEAENSGASYYIVSFNSPAAKINDGTLEKGITITVFKDSNIIEMLVDPGNIKNFKIPEEFLTFYDEISDEDMEFLRILTGEE
ncbi:MAG: hypothetical protein HDR71_04925 [Lachnospiraceae bacterium]|nr:hypothetical protein [Lachnospiraceae bacterium]